MAWLAAIGLLAQVMLGGGSGAPGTNEPSIGITSIANTSCGINVGGTCALDPSFDLENDGDPSTTLAWVYSVDTIDDCGGTTGTGWLVATAPLTGTLDDTDSAVAKAAVFTDEDGCAAGNWDATLRVADNGSTPVANDTPQDIAITLTVTAPGTVWTPDFTLYAADGTTATPGGTINCKRPCAIWADATSTTWSHPEDPLGPHAMDGYRWHFADPTDPSANVKGEFFEKDRGKGAFSGYVYDVVGSHTVTLNLDDGRGETGTAAATVVVTDFAASEITCFSSGSAPGISSDCPSGSTRTGSATCGDILTACNASGTDCIAKAARGESYSGCFGINITTSGVFAGISTHGIGARPVFDYGVAFNAAAFRGGGPDMGWFVDSIELDGPSVQGQLGAQIYGPAGALNHSGVLFHDIVATAGSWHSGIAVGRSNPTTELAVWDSTLFDLGLNTSESGGIIVFMEEATRTLFGFSTVADIYSPTNGQGEFAVRLNQVSKSAWRGNTVGGSNKNRTDFAIRARRARTTDHVYFHDNLLQVRAGGLKVIGHDNGNNGELARGEYFYFADNWCEEWPSDGGQPNNVPVRWCFQISPTNDKAPVSNVNNSIAQVAVLRNVGDLRGWPASQTLRTVWFADEDNCQDPGAPCEGFLVHGNIALGDDAAKSKYEGAGGQPPGVTTDIDCSNSVVYDTAGASNPGNVGCGSLLDDLGGSVVTTTDPFNDVAGEPTDWPSVKITTGSALLGAGVDVSDTGVVNPAYSVYEDRFGNAFPNGAADAGVHEDP